MVVETTEITKDDIQAYEDIRRSGITNMFAVNVVCELSGLTKPQVLDIMKNYDKYIEKFNIERD